MIGIPFTTSIKGIFSHLVAQGYTLLPPTSYPVQNLQFSKWGLTAPNIWDKSTPKFIYLFS